MQQATSSYIEDIFVNASLMSAQVVKERFESFGLSCKELERLQNEAKVLGLQ